MNFNVLLSSVSENGHGMDKCLIDCQTSTSDNGAQQTGNPTTTFVADPPLFVAVASQHRPKTCTMWAVSSRAALKKALQPGSINPLAPISVRAMSVQHEPPITYVKVRPSDIPACCVPQ